MVCQREKELPPLPPQARKNVEIPVLPSVTNDIKSTTPIQNIPSLNRHKTVDVLDTPKEGNSSLSKQSIGAQKKFVPQLSIRRSGPTLTLNLSHSSNSEVSGNNDIVSRPFDASLTSPHVYSASSADEAFLFSQEDNELTPSEKSKYMSLSMNSNNETSDNMPSHKKKIVINQNPPSNMLSVRSMNKEKPELSLSSKSLHRRNIKKLTLDPIDTSNLQDSKLDTPLFSSTSSLGKMEIKDPDRRIDADELIQNIKNLELGLEYQMPIRAEELVSLKRLGSGQSGTVSKVLHLPTQKTMARKTVHLEAKEVIQSQIMRELRIMHECDSPFIIEFYGTFMHEGNVVICMEYADCGSLEHVFKITGPFPEFMLKHVAYCVLSGLIYLYDNHRIIHRDVKPSNVLLTSKGKIKLCDFGVSRELINSMADTFVGTSTYMSPERIQGGVYSVKGDVWSLGIMLYELASGKLAFTNSESGQTSILELLQRIVNEQPPSLSVKDGFSREVSDFVSLCLKKEKQRSSPWELMSHPFLADFLEEDGVRVNSKYRGDIRKWAKNVRRVQKGKPVKTD